MSDDLLELARSHPFYADRFLDDGTLPVLSKAELYRRLGQLEGEPAFRHGTYWSPSGGSAARAPLYFPTALKENWRQRAVLARWLERGGILGEHSVALNLFSGSQMYRACEIFSSYVESLGGTSLPLAFQARDEVVLQAIDRFRPDVVMGSPGRLVQFAHFLRGAQRTVNIPRLLYASEPLYRGAEELLRATMGVTQVASVMGSAETGVWGFSTYQDPRGHFSAPHELVHLEILEPDEEGFGRLIVTNRVRRRHPLLRYDGGDRARWLRSDDNATPDLLRIELGGRSGLSFQFAGQYYDCQDFQMILEGAQAFQFVLDFPGRDRLCLRLVEAELSADRATEELRRVVRFYAPRMEVSVETCRPGDLEKAPGSGKVIPIVDRRCK